MYKESLRQVWIEVDMGAYDHNMKAIQKHVGEDTPCIGVIKANAYGHGATECAKVLAYNGMDSMAVATLEEGVNLREDGIQGNIVLLGLTPAECQDVVVENQLIPVIGSYEGAAALNDAVVEAKKNGTVPADYEQKCWFALDTGMGRIGFRVFNPEEIAYAVEEYKKVLALPEVNPAGVMTHFSSADEEQREYTEMQIANYDAFIAKLAEEDIHPKKICSNSAAIMVYPQVWYDAVRPGIISYGIYPSDCLADKVIDLKPVMSVKAEILNLKTVPAGTSVSYGRKFTSEKDTKVGTLGLGYADGFSRRNSGKVSVLVGGKRCPIIGNICMDQCMVDVTEVEDVKVGDEVVIMGTQGSESITVEELANLTGTIPHEITCSFDLRLPKVYVNYPEGMCEAE